MDRPGTALSLFGDVSGKDWKAIGDGQDPRSIVANHEEVGLYRTFTMGPKSLSGQIAISKGIDLRKVHTDDNFRMVGSIVDSFMREFQVKELTRCGVRYVCIGKIGGDPAQKLPKLMKTVDPVIAADFSSKLGTPTDMAVVVEGQDEADVHYRTIFGPLFEADIIKHMDPLKLDQAELEYLVENDVMFDIDLWERDFTFVSKSFYRWCEDKHATAITLTKGVASTIQALHAS